MDKITGYCTNNLPAPGTACNEACTRVITRGGVNKVATTKLLPCTAAIKTAMTANLVR